MVPVLQDEWLPIEGELVLPVARGPRRVVLLVDASSSANARTSFETASGGSERVSVLEAERRALDQIGRAHV